MLQLQVEGWRVGKDTSSCFDSNMLDVLIWRAYRDPQVAGYSIFLQGLDAMSHCLLEFVVGNRVFWCLLSLGVFGNEANIRAVWTPPLSLG